MIQGNHPPRPVFQHHGRASARARPLKGTPLVSRRCAPRFYCGQLRLFSPTQSQAGRHGVARTATPATCGTRTHTLRRSSRMSGYTHRLEEQVHTHTQACTHSQTHKLTLTLTLALTNHTHTHKCTTAHLPRRPGQKQREYVALFELGMRGR